MGFTVENKTDKIKTPPISDVWDFKSWYQSAADWEQTVSRLGNLRQFIPFSVEVTGVDPDQEAALNYKQVKSDGPSIRFAGMMLDTVSGYMYMGDVKKTEFYPHLDFFGLANSFGFAVPGATLIAAIEDYKLYGAKTVKEAFDSVQSSAASYDTSKSVSWNLFNMVQVQQSGMATATGTLDPTQLLASFLLVLAHMGSLRGISSGMRPALLPVLSDEDTIFFLDTLSQPIACREVNRVFKRLDLPLAVKYITSPATAPTYMSKVEEGLFKSTAGVDDSNTSYSKGAAIAMNVLDLAGESEKSNSLGQIISLMSDQSPAGPDYSATLAKATERLMTEVGIKAVVTGRTFSAMKTGMARQELKDEMQKALGLGSRDTASMNINATVSNDEFWQAAPRLVRKADSKMQQIGLI